MCSSSLALVLLAATPTLTLDEALSLALQHNATLKVARAEIGVAEASVPLLHDWEMPKLRLQLGDAQAVPTGAFTWNVRLSWAPPNPFQWKPGTEAGQAEIAQRRAELAAASWDVVKDLRLAWLDLSGAAAHEKLARDTLEVRRRLLSVLRSRLERGAGTQVDLNLAQLGEQDAIQEELRWQNSGLRAVQSIGWLVGRTVAPAPAMLPSQPPPIPSLDEMQQRLTQHPVLFGLRAKLRKAEARQRFERAKLLPWPDVQLGLRQKTGAAPENDVQAALVIPLGVTPAPQADVERATVVRNQAQLDAETMQRQTELRILIARAEGLRDRWLSFELDYRKTLDSHATLRARLIADGTLDPTALLTAERQAIDLEHKRIEVQLDLARALVELENVAGPAGE